MGNTISAFSNHGRRGGEDMSWHLSTGLSLGWAELGVVSRAYPGLGVATGRAFVCGNVSWRLGRGGGRGRARGDAREERVGRVGNGSSLAWRRSRRCPATGSCREEGALGRGARGGFVGMSLVSAKPWVGRGGTAAWIGRTHSAAGAIAGGGEGERATGWGEAEEKGGAEEERGSDYCDPWPSGWSGRGGAKHCNFYKGEGQWERTGYEVRVTVGGRARRICPNW
ncbi:hypothetical protein F5148DRAFT_1146259 [Russula earlei]|uniref:Uncharacterized protein n=1 Tax=Russula earlei TaxID=71964 RepID=A0ACC0UKE6_9AGAM|nr:hypothetical protein F5148DRAFT_1146259 [Russula earlei]